MFQELDLVRLKNDNLSIGVTKKEVGVIVDIIKNKNSVAYTVEFVDDDGNTNMLALEKYFKEDELEKANQN